MSHLSNISISIFLHHCLTTLKCFVLMQNPLQLDIWLQSYAGFENAKNNIKQRNFNPVYANISKTTSPTSDSFLLIMLHLQIYWLSPKIFSSQGSLRSLQCCLSNQGCILNSISIKTNCSNSKLNQTNVQTNHSCMSAKQSVPPSQPTNPPSLVILLFNSHNLFPTFPI